MQGTEGRGRGDAGRGGAADRAGAEGAPSPVARQVMRIIADQALLDVADLRPEATLAELGLDSLGLAEAVFALEEAFDIQIPFNAAAAEEGGQGPMQGRIADVIALVEALVAARDQGIDGGAGADGSGAG